VFDKLSARLAAVVEGLRGRGRLTEENIGDTLRQVRMALLEADVALPVVKEFIDAVKARAIGLEIHKSLTPGQALVRVIHEELVRVMGEGARPINMRAQPPVAILLGVFLIYQAFRAFRRPVLATAAGSEIEAAPDDYVQRLEEELRKQK
jgi:signal recognition particle subunit SRP54